MKKVTLRKEIYVAILEALAFAIIAMVVYTENAANEGRDIVSATGTVKYIELEGGFYGIITDDGQRYYPLNLPEEFRVDGLKVRFVAKVRSEVIGIHMWGTPVEILDIEEMNA